ncbi:B3 DNA binding domain [Arabidopsis thaliana x Arabidopsis arenosa]|uniref:B3 DNA binding domain n=1 Tax=Arabidopsis thaliana x Arabidopsis arenosa TaxID=1240361 RepID=A0A8T2BTW1_9BRAS|nr:B3 DNA binding domain [Arabidopsis thaliana x Arabidopsis arenosa]
MTTNDYDHTAKRNTMGSISKLYELAGVEATLNDAEQRARKGKAKIVSKEEDNVFIKKKKEDDDKESEKKKFFSHVPRKIRPALRYPQPNFENPNGASTSSSSPFSSTLSLENYIPEYKKTEMKNPSNPNHQWSPSPWLMEYTSPTEMREMLLQRRCSGGFKRPKVSFIPRRTREMPWWQFQVMRDMNGEDLTLILEKTLSKSDVNPTMGRLLMPYNSLIRNDFLTPEERSIIEEDIDNDDDEKMEVGAILVDPRFEKWGVVLKKWEVGNHSGNVSWNYCLTCGWNDVVKANDLKDGDNIGVWAFRCGGILCFALVPLSFTMRSQGRSYLRF